MPSDVYFIMCPKCKTPMRVDAPACTNCGRENPAAAKPANGSESGGGSPVMTGKAALLEDTDRPKTAIIAAAVAAALLGIFLCLRGFGVFGGSDEGNGGVSKISHGAADGAPKRFADGDDPKKLARKAAAPTATNNSGVTYMGGGGGAPALPPPVPVYQQPQYDNSYAGGGTAVGAQPTYQAPPRPAPVQFANQNQRVITQPSLPSQGGPGEGLSRGYGTPSQGNNDAVIVGSH